MGVHIKREEPSGILPIKELRVFSTGFCGLVLEKHPHPHYDEHIACAWIATDPRLHPNERAGGRNAPLTLDDLQKLHESLGQWIKELSRA